MRVLLMGSLVLLLAACAPQKPADTPEAGTTKPASITCPAIQNSDTAAVFGLDATMAMRVDQVVRLSRDLEASATALDQQARALCATVAQDLDPAPLPAGPHPCVAAKDRFKAFVERLPRGVKLEVAVTGVSCAVPKRALEQCAGECLTGKSGVTSAVSCKGASLDACSVDASFPEAGAACTARCSARALALSACTANVELRAEGAEDVAPQLEALRRDLPKLVGLGAELAPKAAQASVQAARLVDELAAAIDSLTASGDRADRRVVSAAVLASCVAPELAQTVRAGAQLRTSLEGAVALHQAVVAR